MEFFGHPNNDTARHKIIDLLIQGIRIGDEILEAVVANAAQVVNAPIALITFVHRHQLMHLSKYGIEADSSSAEDSFCIHRLTEAEFTEISDAMLDLCLFQAVSSSVSDATGCGVWQRIHSLCLLAGVLSVISKGILVCGRGRGEGSHGWPGCAGLRPTTR